MKYKIKKQQIYIFLSLSLILLVFGACGLIWGWKDGSTKEAIIVENYDVQPREDINIEMNFHVKTIGDAVNTDRLVIAVQVPAILNPRTPGVLEVTWENRGKEVGELLPMRMLAEDEYPKQLTGGITWEQHLMSRFRDDDPNLLDGMQWVAFVAEESVTISSQTWDLTARIKIKTNDQYWKAKIGLCAYRESRGGDDNEPAGMVEETINYINDWTQCISVVGDDDEEDIMDFCYFHFNKHLPASSTQNDIVTIIFNGDVADNQLLNAGDIYLNTVATTTDGKIYAVSEISEKTKMTQEDEFGYTYTKTFWPEEYFGIPANETIAKIEYYYTNSDGSKYVSRYDDRIKDDEGVTIPSPKPVEPFLFLFQL